MYMQYLPIQPRNLENVQDIMHIALHQPKRQHRPREVRVAVEIEVLPREQFIDYTHLPSPLVHSTYQHPTVLAPSNPFASLLTNQLP